LQTALRLVTLDPVQEQVHRTLMLLHAELGDRGAALRQYQLCVSALSRELRAAPEPETKALYREILQRRLALPLVVAPEPARQDPQPAPGPPQSESPLVGRGLELGRLREALQGAWTGRARVVAVIGEAGIGKSRLAAELGEEVHRTGGRVLVGHCHESERVLPFAPWIDALRGSGLVDDEELLGALGPVWRAELSRLLPEIAAAPPGPATADAAQLFEAVAQLLERVASARPVLLVLEDLHWSDEMSLRLLAFLGRRLARSRVLGAVTVREEDLPRSAVLRHTLDELDREGLVRCALGPLGREDAQVLARTLVPSSEAARLDEQLWRASEGNPFMIVETLRALRGGEAPAGTAALPIPERVRKLVAYRMERLGDRARRLAAVAAVIGRPFEWALLERAADLDEAEAADGVEELVRHRILHFDDDRLQFTHDCMREVVSGELFPALRAVLHRRVAEALEQLHAGQLGAHASALGAHYREGQVWTKAVFYLQEAAMQASLRYAQRESVTCYEQALAALARVPDSRETREQGIDLRFRLAFSLYGLRAVARALTCIREAEDLALALGDQRRLGEVLVGMTHALASEGNLEGASQTGLRALTVATALGELDLRVWSSLDLGRVHYARGDYRRAIDLMRWVARTVVTGAPEDVPIDQRFAPGAPPSSVGCRGWLAICLADTGDFPEALAWGAEGVRIAEAEGGLHAQVFASYCLSRVYLARGDADQAIPLLEKAIALCEGRVLMYRSRAIASLARAQTMVGNLAVALRLLREAADEVQTTTLVFGSAMVLVWTSAVHREADQLEEADRYASAALELSRSQGGRGDEAWALHALAEIAARRDPPESALAFERSARALALAQELGMAPLQARCHLSLGVLHHQAGAMAAARDALTPAVDMLSRMQMRRWLGTAQALLATSS
jgi:tetratricopeptide (TPR) repeat protein